MNAFRILVFHSSVSSIPPWGRQGTPVAPNPGIMTIRAVAADTPPMDAKRPGCTLNESPVVVDVELLDPSSCGCESSDATVPDTAAETPVSVVKTLKAAITVETPDDVPTSCVATDNEPLAPLVAVTVPTK